MQICKTWTLDLHHTGSDLAETKCDKESPHQVVALHQTAHTRSNDLAGRSTALAQALRVFEGDN